MADRQRLTGIDAVPNERLFPPVMWQPGEVVDDPRTVDIPADLEPGRYVLEVGAYYRDKGEKRRIPATIRGKTQDTVIVGSWLILPDASGLARSQPLDARFGPAMLLRGYDEEWAADHLTVRLYWESTRPIDHSFTVSVQILNPAGQMVAQHDGVPGVGHLPTTEWPADRVIRDDHTIAVSRGEDLSISVVVYDPATLQRLPLQGGAGSGDRLMLR
ncbi:MAG TPA: hypothetical protein VFZ25_11395 [Chloroflexota bacterium]|nr:hypothetical protein [Chloroflexota bacterium]